VVFEGEFKGLICRERVELMRVKECENSTG